MIPLLAGLAHHSEPGDPVLLAWIQDRIDAIVGLGAGAFVLVVGAVILLIPLGIVIAFAVQRLRQRRI